MSAGEYQQRLLAVLLEATNELDAEDLDKFLRGATIIVSTAVAARWDTHADRPEGWS